MPPPRPARRQVSLKATCHNRCKPHTKAEPDWGAGPAWHPKSQCLLGDDFQSWLGRSVNCADGAGGTQWRLPKASPTCNLTHLCFLKHTPPPPSRPTSIHQIQLFNNVVFRHSFSILKHHITLSPTHTHTHTHTRQSPSSVSIGTLNHVHVLFNVQTPFVSLNQSPLSRQASQSSASHFPRAKHSCTNWLKVGRVLPLSIPSWSITCTRSNLSELSILRDAFIRLLAYRPS